MAKLLSSGRASVGALRANPLVRCASLSLLFGVTLSTAGCSTNNNSGISFAFDRPEYVELVCLDETDPDNVASLPMRCCAPDLTEEPLAPLDSPYLYPLPPVRTEEMPNPVPSPIYAGCVNTDPVLHALVTQSVRGEVAAVDLETRKVLDSDQRIPGFTFIDVGGFPTAVVVPLERPTPGYEPDPVQGPPWTYVASGSDSAVRAVATCRFKEGAPCGPELPDGNLISGSELELFLPGPPADMFIGPDEALWVSLPNEGLLARVQLAPSGMMPEPDVNKAKPFLMDPDTAATDRPTPEDPQYFTVPQPDEQAPEALLDDPAVDDQPPYVSYCGLGYNYQPGQVTLPPAPRVPIVGTVSPGRMRYDALSQLLFVSDQNLPVLHVFTLGTDGTLTTRGTVPVGVPLKDFALTPDVSEEPAPLFSSPVPVPQKRYLYGLDAAGGLLAFQLTASPTGASLVPLKAPVPERYSDRFFLLSRTAVGAALEVVDTRPDSPEQCGIGKDDIELSPIYTKEEQVSIASQLQDQLDDAKTELADTTNKLKGKTQTLAEQKELADKTLARDKAQRRLEIARGAGPQQLRGVFLFVISLAGEVNVIDILDLDIRCRAETSCKPPENSEAVFLGQPPEPQLSPLLSGTGSDPGNVQTGTSPLALSMQRNAPRLLVGQEPTVQVSTIAAFDVPQCDSPYVGAEEPLAPSADMMTPGKPLICVVADPWAQRDQTWVAQVDAAVPLLPLGVNVGQTRVVGIAGGVLSQTEGAPPDQVVITAPAGVSLCGVGAQDGVGDVVAVLGGASSNSGPKCAAPTAGAEPRLKILEAFDDHLVLRALGLTKNADPRAAELTAEDQAALGFPVSPSSAIAEVKDLLECYKEFITFQVRTGNSLVRECPVGADCSTYVPPKIVEMNNDPSMTTNDELVIEPVYLVTGTVSGYLHRMIAGEGGRCVEDPLKDPRYRARATQGDPFLNTQLGFTLSATAPAIVNIASTAGSAVLRTSIVTQDLPAARPTSIHYFPYTNDLFVVDSATQGLRRLQFEPFGLDPNAIYR